MEKLKNLLEVSEKMKTAKSKKVVLVLPYEWVQNSQTKKYELKIQNQNTVDVLILTIQATLGTDIEVKLEPYSMRKNSGEKDHGIFIVNVPPKGKGDVRYQTWYSEGKLTEDALSN